MSHTMTKAEREAFLAEPRVAILALSDKGRGPLAVPIWYIYEPGGELWFLTAKASPKGRLLKPEKRISLCVQTETRPYKYVSVEGPITRIGTATTDDHLLPMAQRYRGEADGRSYAESLREALASGSRMLVHMAPERWLTLDYAKAGESGQ
ncbi:MAG: pyridoxamine 5'-phosphate oxidase family protein [Alphaproteobacteria bacterium]|jgi:general stress protein 26|nr:pyridoxamine 5'-phosphate oxidase family protein [Alphaproteobacteria bacterium]MDP6812983.1 pyridoxamine 5'-phosphate oxidase family protein [Alphaproteobacteria bacterium]